MATMTLGGLWHGARWNFIIWGVYQGALLVAQRLWRFVRGDKPTDEKPSAFTRVVSIVIMFQFICLGWLFFRAQRALDIQHLLYQLMLGWGNLPAAWPQARPLVIYAALLVVLEILMYRKTNRYIVQSWPMVARAALYIVLYLCITLGAPNSGRVFIYFQF
jgi:D-alanyl-lipoteichoic acid acyltransferase DltB (MBOAT superfamily)